MENLKRRIAEVSESLQLLMEPGVFPEVQSAVEKKDKDLIVEVCRKVRIPEIYIGIIVAVLLSVGPEQIKWPLPQY